MTGWVVVRRDKWTFHGVVHLQGRMYQAVYAESRYSYQL